MIHFTGNNAVQRDRGFTLIAQGVILWCYYMCSAQEFELPVSYAGVRDVDGVNGGAQRGFQSAKEYGMSTSSV